MQSVSLFIGGRLERFPNAARKLLGEKGDDFRPLDAQEPIETKVQIGLVHLEQVAEELLQRFEGSGLMYRQHV